MIDPKRVFVYGTLKSGQPNNPVLRGARLIGAGETAQRYRMFSNGFFPMIIRDREGYKIHGELYEVDGDTMDDLDQLEGVPHHYYRDAATIVLEDGKMRTAYIYVYAQPITTQTEVPSGEWKGR